MYQNNIYIFYFLKFIFDISISKRSKNTKSFNLKLKKINFFFKASIDRTTKQSFHHLCNGPKYKPLDELYPGGYGSTGYARIEEGKTCL